MSAGKRSFGAIRKLPSERYQAHYTTPTGAVVKASGTFAAKIHAEAWLVDRRREIDENRWNPGAAERTRERVTFADYAQTWLAGRQVGGRPIKARTRAHYAGIIARELKPAFGPQLLTAITPADVRKWYAKTLVDKPTMRAHAYDLLRTILSTAFEDELVDANPCRIRGAGSVRCVHKVTPASIAEIETIAAKMPVRLQLAVVCASWLAMRLGETLELRRGDVDLDAGVVRIRRAVVRAGGTLQIDTPKTAAGVRDVAIPPHLVERFRDHLAQHTGAADDALLFPSGADSTRWLQAKALYKDYRKARAAAGRDDLRWHDLRHSGAVLAATAGATLAELMARLGHSTPQAAMRYQHAAEGRDRIVAAAMSKLAAAD
ncbi:site-specific integrase [Mycobacterium numidiamassiliense]|uniref:Site-specific integrase n=1 Tax=Mycobacterium numidiamassiliense TaxID=1841861 RepID=A0A2U3PI10_9MYCO|nr:tyrosine-type recombinase/integrase [Mycobacterium numidiamassiliense]SPM43339.1 site-specific integrase [Mycobacterium numidiamassiliense]